MARPWAAGASSARRGARRRVRALARARRRWSSAFRSRNAAFQRRQLLRRLGRPQRGDYFAEVAVENRLQLVERQADSMVGDAALGVVVRADAITAVAAADQALARRRFAGRALGAFLRSEEHTSELQ